MITIRTKLFGNESENVSFLAATGTVLGFTHIWPAGIFILVGLLLWKRYFIWWNKWLVAASGIILISSIWSDDPVSGALYFITLNVLYAVWKSPIDKRKLFRWGMILTLGIAMLAQIEITWFGDIRPEALSKDASILGLSGMSFASPLAGFSGSRTAVAGIWLFAILTLRWTPFILAIVATLALFYAALFVPESVQRFTIEAVQHADSLRDTISVSPVEAPWYGFGYHSYNFETGAQRPHNIFILSWYELGLLSIPFWTFVLFSIKLAAIPWRIIAIFIPVGLLTDEFFARPEGLFVIFSLGLMAYYWPARITHLARIRARIKIWRDVPVKLGKDENHGQETGQGCKRRGQA